MAVKPTKPADDAAANVASLRALAESLGLLGSSTDTDNPFARQVWLGHPAKKGDPRKDPYEKGSANSGFKASNIELAAALPHRWLDTSKVSNRKQLERLFKAVSDATGQQVRDFDTAFELWQKAVERASLRWQATRGGKDGRPTTPWDELARAARDRQAGIANSLAGTGTGPRTTTSRSVSEISDGDAWSVVNKAVTDLLGRAASNSEVQEFAHRANRIAADNPTVTTTTTKYDAAGRPVSESSKTRQGASAGDYERAAREQANSDPEAGAYQAAATYYPALLNVLGSMANLQNPA